MYTTFNFTFYDSNDLGWGYLELTFRDISVKLTPELENKIINFFKEHKAYSCGDDPIKKFLYEDAPIRVGTGTEYLEVSLPFEYDRLEIVDFYVTDYIRKLEEGLKELVKPYISPKEVSVCISQNLLEDIKNGARVTFTVRDD